MTRYLLMTSSIISVFVLSWGLNRQFSPQNCINSTMVGKVVISESKLELDQCSLEVRLFGPNINDEFRQLNLIDRIQNLEKVKPNIESSGDSLIVRILPKDSNEFVVTQKSISISSKFVSKPGFLEKAILSTQLSRSTSLASNVLVDFLWNELVENNPLPEIQPWIYYAKSLKSYCQWDQKLADHISFCEAYNEYSDGYITEADSDAVPWALIPVFTFTLRSVYKSLSLFDKQRFLENIKFLGDWEEDLIETLKKQKSLKLAEQVLFGSIKNWLLPTLVDESLVNTSLSLISINKGQSIDLIYLSRSSRNSFPLYYSEDSNVKFGSLKNQYVIQHGREQFFIPSDTAFKFEKRELYKEHINNFIYVSCRMPEVSSLLSFEEYTSKVIYLKLCDPNEVNWSELYEAGVTSYLKNHKETQFIEFNLTALKIAQKLRGPLKDSDNFLSWQRWLMWQRIIDDQNFKIKRPLSAIDGVGRYRIF